MYSSKSDVDESQSKIDTTNLYEIIEQAFSIGETDGVQDAILSHNILTRLSSEFSAEEAAEQLIDVAIEAAGQNNRGTLAAILNAILGSCCGSNEDASSTSCHPHISLAILDMMDKMHAADESSMVTPDIVTLSLVYYTTTQSSEEFESESQVLLERAQKSAKKMAGSRRRRELVAERRRGSSEIDTEEVQSMLQSLYGPDICILYDTDDVIVMSKPAGMVCYHSKKTSAGKITSSRKKKSREASKSGKQHDGNIDISLVDALGQSFSLSTLNPTARGIVHRLDRGTSGTIVLAKNDDMHMGLVALFFLRRVKKKYLALVPGCAIASGEDGATADSEHIQLSVGSTGVMDSPVDGRPAQSTYKVVAEYGVQQQDSSSPEALLLEVETLTGRKHQVRVHCASLGHSIFLDPLYHPSSSSKLKVAEKGPKKKKNRRNPNTKAKNAEVVELPTLPKAVADLLEESNTQERFFLHAASLSIPEMDIPSPLPSPLPGWWTDAIDQMK